MDNEALLQQLLDACNEGSDGAITLARRPDAEPLRDLLRETAQQYRSAADDIRRVWRNESHTGVGREPRTVRRVEVAVGDDIAATWERAECETLTYFRDAYDTALPPPVADTVKRHFEAAVRRLERLRALQTQQR